MRTCSRLTWAFPAAMVVLSGCQPLKVEKTLTLGGGQVKTMVFDPPRYEQKVTVQVHSPDAPVSAFLVLESDAEATQDALMGGKTPPTPLASQEKAEDITLEAKVPAKNGFALVLRADKKKSEVTVKVTGR